VGEQTEPIRKRPSSGEARASGASTSRPARARTPRKTGPKGKERRSYYQINTIALSLLSLFSSHPFFPHHPAITLVFDALPHTASAAPPITPYD